MLMALMMGATSESWAQESELTKSDIVVDGGIRNGETFEYTIDYGSVTVKEVDAETRNVTISITPDAGYCILKSDIIVQKLADPAVAGAPRRAPDIADPLVVSGLPKSKSATDYSFVVPADYAGALVTVTFRKLLAATVPVTPNSLTYTGSPIELVTLGTVVGTQFDSGTKLAEDAPLAGYYTKTDDVYTPCSADGKADGETTYYKPLVTYSTTENGTYSSTIPTGTNAGTYTVFYKYVADDSHVDGSGSVSVVIGKASITSVSLKEYVKKYTGSALTFSLIDENPVKAGEISVPSDDYDVSGDALTTQTAVGTYTCTVTANPTSTNFTGSAFVNFRIVEATTVFIGSSTEASDITVMDGKYVLTDDIKASVLANLSSGTFTGELDGNFHKIDMKDYSHALFNTISGGTVKNVILDNVSISSGTNVGAIANKLTGTSSKMGSIYNCGVLPGGSLSGSGYVGSIVGQLGDSNDDNCYARVINCYSYATVGGGSDVGGIVGYNDFASTATNIRTMVMNCMFYGDITSGTNKSPVYGGDNINNLNSGGLATYNYYAYEQLPTNHITSGKYNCALAVEEKYLNRFEFYRLLLNSNKKLAAIYATGSAANANEMAKWVLETADRTIDTPKPYPILKAQGYYPSIVNPDFANAPDSTTVGRNQGGKLGKTLSVTISGTKTDGGQTWPTGASITTSSLTLQRTDKDFDRFNFNYDKVQLPYYNDVGTGNYTGNRVVTGWKITYISPVEDDPYTSDNYDYDKKYSDNPEYFDYPNYNFADRKSSNKDLYTVSKRVFSQGAYFDVPYGVTSITIEPYWGKACYIADQYYDAVYNTDYSKQDVSQTGTQAKAGTTYFDGINFGITTQLGAAAQKIENTISNALTYISGTLGGYGPTVYDNAVVLVGNLHQVGIPSQNTNPFTLMSVDLDDDHEPDYSMIYHHSGKKRVCPIRFDFLNIPGTSQAQKPNGASKIFNMAIIHPSAWFEITNTSSIYFCQLEYEDLVDNGSRTEGPLILQGGVLDQFVSTNNSAVNGKTIYMHLGGNVWFKEFNMGTHGDGSQSTPHPPVSVTGGEYEGFYLTGIYNQDAAVRTDNAECYISGGHFGEVAGTGQEAINGNVRWQIYNADIDNFFGGGTNGATGKNIKGDVRVDIFNSHVTTFCGGPKFGNMESKKKVTTNAEGCVFGKFFGAGFGGTAYSRKKYYDKDDNPVDWSSKQSYYTTDRGKYFDGNTTSCPVASYGKKGIGVATDFDYEYFVWSSGPTGGRFYVKFASFSLAQCNDVESTLKKCTIETNFYGGGNLGKVVGTATSILEDCTVKGSVYGAGYSASLPTVEVRDAGFTTYPNYNSQSGMFEPGVFSGTTTFTWQNAAAAGKTLTNGQSGSDLDNHILYTNTVLTGLGSVANTKLTINGTTTVGESVYGGGEESVVEGNTEVIITSGTIGAEGKGGAEFGNVYGGGKGKDDEVKGGLVKGNTKVKISQAEGKSTIVYHNVYGGGAYGSVGTYSYDENDVITGHTEDTGKTEVIITGGTFGWNGKENGMVFGSSRGDVGAPDGIEDKMAWVYDTEVKIGTPGQGFDAPQPQIKGSVYGSGENGHNYHDANVYIYSGTIGIAEGSPITDDNGTPENEDDDKTYNGVEYIYRGNVYGGGCGTDKYYAGSIPDGHTLHDGNGDTYNPLAGIVRGDATITMTGGRVVRNIYGAGAMGSVGTADVATSGKTTITISGGTVGVNGTVDADGIVGDGNVFGAARGSADVTSNEYALVRNKTEVNISGKASVKGSVYGGGELGCVGRYTISDDMRNFYWTDLPSASIDPANPATYTYNNTGVCNVNITGGTVAHNVFGGGRGKADTFWCEKGIAYQTNVSIKNSGTVVKGSVFGGGEIGRVEDDTKVEIGTENDSDAPEITGNVFGAGKGLKTHGYSALVRGNVEVTIQGGAKVGESVYGGGEIASVGRYKIKEGPNTPEGAPDWVLIGMPYSLANNGSGKCTVIVRDNAEIGPDGMKMYHVGVAQDKPDDTGHVIGACMGVLPYEGVAGGESGDPWRVAPGDIEEHFTDAYYKKTYGEDYKDEHDYEADYFKFIESLALATETDVTISGNAFVKGSVYGGSLNGHVQHNTKVTIEGGQIGAGDGMTEPYKETDWTGSTTPTGGWKACAAWTYADNGTPYDLYATYSKTVDGKVKYYYDAACTKYAEGGANVATDGHTYYGNVFGGGSGVIPYAPGKWHRGAGSVDGNIQVNITGGHILSNVYGGNEQTDVGTYTKDSNGLSTATPVSSNPKGNCVIKISGGTIGVPRNDVDIKKLPTIGHLYGGGKGDKRIFFNTWTNVISTEVNITGNARIYGSTFGGGEDGHVLGNAVTTINGADLVIGCDGTSGYDGNVFGGGQGSSTALTAGVVGGNVTLNIQNGTMKGSVYGGGRLAAVGTHFENPDGDNYGELHSDNPTLHGNISVNLTGGTIHQDVFGGGMGITNVDNADRFAISRNVTVHLNKDVETTAKGCIVKGRIFGANNANASPKGDVLVHIHATQNEGTADIATKVKSVYDVDYVFGGGNNADYVPTETGAKQSTEVIIEGCDLTSIEEVYGGGYGAATPGTKVEVRGTKIIDNVFGGGYGAGENNPGANVGIRTDGTTEYGNTGAGVKTAVVRLMAGNVNNVYGGSNTKGDIRGGSSITNIDKTGQQGTNKPCCDNLNVNNIYGGGKDAEMAGGAEIVLGCMPNDWISEIYAGAENADVGNDVSLTLTSGKFGRVFGGNKSGGKLDGKIEVNIEESETCGTPIIIGELYGGGNLAPYSIYGYNDDGTPRTEAQLNVTPHNSPRVNVRRFTSIGNIFGGGLGANAVMVGSPTVNINEVAFDTSVEGYEPNAYNPATDNTKPSWIGDGVDQVKLWPHTNGQMGVIGNVFGGGNAAQVIGDTYVNIGTESSVKFESIIDNTIEGDDKRVSMPVVGADIRGNVFGGGNNAAVTGDSHVTIGKEEVVTPAPQPNPAPAPNPAPQP